MKTKLLLATFAILILIQFFPIKKENPAIDTKHKFSQLVEIPTSTKALLKAACYDCHSHETEFPGYTRMQPLGWWIRGHIRGGRLKVNFSEWGTYTDKEKVAKIQECKEVLEEGRMPLGSYKLLHPESKLKEAEIKELVGFFDNL